MSETGVTITAKLEGTPGRKYNLRASDLAVTNDRFHGTGSLGGLRVEVDGRLDGDGRRGQVLKKGRTFTFNPPTTTTPAALGGQG